MRQNLCLLLLLAHNIFAQQPITLLSSDMPTQGWIGGRVARDTIIGNIQWGNAGANQTYIFTNLQPMILDTNYYLSLTAGQASAFPDADLAVTADNINYLFTNTTANDFRWEGLAGTLNGCSSDIVFNPVTTLYQFPSQYGGNFTNSTGFQVIAAGSCVGQPVYQIRVTSTSTAWDTIDGWGKVTTPIGSYKCIRQKRRDVTNTVIDVKLFSFSPWSNFSTTVDTNVRYYYNTKESKGSVITFGYDSLDNPVSASWSLNPPSAPVADFSSDTSAGGQVNFTDLTDGYPDTYTWSFGDGSTSSQQSPMHVYTFNGTYIVCLTVSNAGGSTTDCDTIVVTNATGVVNTPPVAQNDTYTVSYPGSLYLHPYQNDTDPENQTLLTTDMCTPMHGTVTPGGVAYLYEPDSCFIGIDSFCYVVCDVGSPSLCDTGMIFIDIQGVTVAPDASFNYNVVSQMVVYAANTSQNTDGTSHWIIHENGNGQTYELFTDSIQYTSVNSWNVNIDLCLVVESCYGVTDTVCESILYTIEDVNEVVESELQVFPNPTNDQLFVSSGHEGFSTCEVLDEIGNLVYRLCEPNAVKWQRLDLSKLPAAVYLLQVYSGNEVTGRVSFLVTK